MKKNRLILLLFIMISFFSCSNADKNQIILNSDISTDFPISSKLDFKRFNKYNLQAASIKDCIIEDSTLWITTMLDPNNFGYCFNLNTGKELSVIANRGKAANEFLVMYKAVISGDSIQLYSGINEIKTFAKKDIIENKPMYERNYSYIAPPDTLFTSNQIKLADGSVLATVATDKISYSDFTVGGGHNPDAEFNEESVAVFNNDKVNLYETIKYDSFNSEGDASEKEKNMALKYSYSASHIGLNDNDMAIFALRSKLILYTFNLNNKKVVKEKRYGKITVGKSWIKDDMDLITHSIKCSDKYIVCIVSGYLNEKDKESKILKDAILVFDWALNPIKRFDLEEKEGIKRNNYFISEDCNAVYFYEEQEDGITLFKSDLGLQ